VTAYAVASAAAARRAVFAVLSASACRARRTYVHCGASAARWAVRMRPARIHRSDPSRTYRWTARPGATLAHVWTRWLHSRASDCEGTPCTGRKGGDADVDAPLCCSTIVLLRWGTRCTANHFGCAALHSLQQVAPGCCLLQRTALRCNRLNYVATSSAARCGTCCTATMLAALRCNGIDHWCLHCAVLAAPGCVRQSVACRIGRHCVATGSTKLQPVVPLFVAHAAL
jgi:hypothetical protein